MVGPKLRPIVLAAALLVAAPLAPASAQVSTPTFAAHELDALVAPIALYPDGLLANVLMASTYPIEVVAAVRWLDQPGNQNLTGEELMRSLDAQTWDPSVKALVAVPQVLRMMDSRLDWMERLGDAFVADQAQVMDAVQALRRKARANGTLRTDGTHRVVERDGAIIIEPASSQVLSVDVYEPPAVYGTWLYPEYPPVYIAPPPDYAVPVFTAPLIVPLWGWSRWDWRRHRIDLDIPRWRELDRHHSHIFIGNKWEHDPRRRGGARAALPPAPATPVIPPPLTPGDPRRGGNLGVRPQSPTAQVPGAPAPGVAPLQPSGTPQPIPGRRRNPQEDHRPDFAARRGNTLGVIPAAPAPPPAVVSPTAPATPAPVFRAPPAPVVPPSNAVVPTPSVRTPNVTVPVQMQTLPHPAAAAGEPKVLCSPGARCFTP